MFGRPTNKSRLVYPSRPGYTTDQITLTGNIPNDPRVMDASTYSTKGKYSVYNPFVDPLVHLGLSEPMWFHLCLNRQNWEQSAPVADEIMKYPWLRFDPNFTHNNEIYDARSPYFKKAMIKFRRGCYGKYSSMRSGKVPSKRSATYFAAHLAQYRLHGDFQCFSIWPSSKGLEQKSGPIMRHGMIHGSRA